MLQSAASAENAGLPFLTRQRTMPKMPEPAGVLTPTPRIERPSVAQCRWRMTENDGSLMQLTSVPSLLIVAEAEVGVVASAVTSFIAITFLSAVGAHATFSNSLAGRRQRRPRPSSSSSRSLSITRPSAV